MKITKPSILLWPILTILAALGLTGGVVVASSELAQPGSIQMVQVPGTHELLFSGRGSYGPIATLVDAGGNTFNAWHNSLEANANITWAEVRRYNPAGVETGRWRLNPESNFKIDGLSMFHSGDDLKVAATNHTYFGTRARDVEMGTIVDVFDYQPGFSDQRGAEGAFQPVGTTVEIDYDRIIDGVADEVMARMQEGIAGTRTGNLRQGIEDKVKDAVGESMDKNLYFTDPKARYAQDAWATFVRDRSYEATQSWHLANPCAPVVPTPTRVP